MQDSHHQVVRLYHPGVACRYGAFYSPVCFYFILNGLTESLVSERLSQAVSLKNFVIFDFVCANIWKCSVRKLEVGTYLCYLRVSVEEDSKISLSSSDHSSFQGSASSPLPEGEQLGTILMLDALAKPPRPWALSSQCYKTLGVPIQ